MYIILKVKKSLYTLFIIYLSSVGCNNNENRYRSLQFIKKYKQEDFSKFKNIGLTIRSYGRDGITLYISDELNLERRKYPYMIIFDEDEKSIKKTSCRLIKDSCAFDTTKLNSLALNFLRYDIGALAVDNDKNVFITVGSSERFNIVRLSNKKFVKDEYREDWHQVDNNWFFKKD